MSTLQLSCPLPLHTPFNLRTQTQPNPQTNTPATPQASAPTPAPRNALPTAPNHRVCCCYSNRTAQFQIIRIVTMANGIASEFLERTVLPYAKVLFEANSHDQLQIHTGNFITSVLSDTIPCHQLIYSEESL